jgi:hypothetical protein
MAEFAKDILGKLKDGRIFGAVAELAVIELAGMVGEGIKAWREGARRVVEVEPVAERSPVLTEAWWREWERAFDETGVRPESPLERGLKEGEGARAEDLDSIARSNCFPAGTLVSTRTGLRPIESVGSGDVVWSFDFRTGAWVECVVGVCHSAQYEGQFVTLELEDGSVLEATEDHPVWVLEGDDLANRPQLKRGQAWQDSGLLLPGRWVYTQALRTGDRLYGRDGKSIGIRSVRIWKGIEWVYNLSVLGLPFYTVGQQGLLVHNTDTGAVPDWATRGRRGRITQIAPPGALPSPPPPEPRLTFEWESEYFQREAERAFAEAEAAAQAGDGAAADAALARAELMERKAQQAAGNEAEWRARVDREREVAKRQAEAEQRRAKIREAKLRGRTPAEAARRRGRELWEEERAKGSGLAAGRSGGHGTPNKRAGARLKREANGLPPELADLAEEFRKEGQRLIERGNADDHPYTR